MALRGTLLACRLGESYGRRSPRLGPPLPKIACVPTASAAKTLPLTLPLCCNYLCLVSQRHRFIAAAKTLCLVFPLPPQLRHRLKPAFRRCSICLPPVTVSKPQQCFLALSPPFAAVDLSLPFVDIPLPFVDLPLSFLDLLQPFVDLLLTFHCLSLTFHCLSSTFHCLLSLTFHCLSLTFPLLFVDLSTAFP